MRIIGRYLAWLILLGAAAVLVRDIIFWHDAQRFAPESLGALWSDLSDDSLRRAHVLIGATWPWGWKSVIEPALDFWAAPILAIVGFWLLWATRAPRRRH